MMQPSPNWQATLARFKPQQMQKLLGRDMGPCPKGKYRHWDNLRHLKAPDGFTSEQWWAAVKCARHMLRRNLPFLDTAGRPFGYVPVRELEERLHRLDSRATGRLAMPEAVARPGHRDRYLISSLIEEAVTSSQLEGAATTRRVAVDMLRSGRSPRDKDEQMIFNNYLAMSQIRTWRDEPMTPERVSELHRMLTEDTLDDPDDAGRPQAPGEDRIAVYDNTNNRVLHHPPAAQYLPERMQAMCEFANRRFESSEFLHPVLHAICLHFWLAWDHPFVDGNGRTARALFYWKMLQADYWLFEFISISTVLRKSLGKYKRAFLETETDDEDLTYFFLHQLDVIEQAVGELEAYLERKQRQLSEAERLLRVHGDLNHRQLSMLSHALRNPDASYTVQSHQRSHGIVYATARSDLLGLVDKGLLIKSGHARKPQRFSVPSDLPDRVKSAT